MKKIVIPISIILALSNCTTNKVTAGLQNQNFRKELVQLQDFFHIPALSVLVKKGDVTIYEDYIGVTDVKTRAPNDSLTNFPMASLTKIFSALAVMKLCEENKLDLEEPVNKYIANIEIADSIKIKHILSHTSQGNVGQNFYYSSRFSWLTAVIEKASGSTFATVINEKIIYPLGLRHTYLLNDSQQLNDKSRKFARPYFYEGEIKTGIIEYGYSAAAGITSTVRDLAKFDNALDNNTLISAASKKKIFTPFKATVPYGLGIFSQKLLNMDLIWGYGQYDCYSSLFLKIPDRKLTVIMSANNNLMSDPARLLYGDVTYSLFALCFLKNYVLDFPDMPLFEDSATLHSLNQRINNRNSEVYRRKLLAQALAESFLAVYDIDKAKISADILEKVFRHYPNYEDYSDLSLLHNLSFLKNISIHHKQGNFTKFDSQIEKIGARLLSIDINNPYANYYLADFYSTNGSNDVAYNYYMNILKLRNYSKAWYTVDAENWIKKNKKINH